ncbi:MAG: hypothetical protein ACYTE8_03500 [Planctomycetota bacterium]|jgi:hypothetical protein
MTATQAGDDNGVEYSFEETSGNPGGSNSGWQSSNRYLDSGLSPETQYTYKVQTRDKSPYHNAGSFSSLASDTTPGVELNNCPDGDLDNNCIVDEIDLNIFAGQWLDNGGENIRLIDANNVTILEFDYEDDWYPVLRRPKGGATYVLESTLQLFSKRSRTIVLRVLGNAEFGKKTH